LSHIVGDMFSAVFLCGLLATASAFNFEANKIVERAERAALNILSDAQLWTQFKADNNRIYKNAKEEALRFAIFAKNMAYARDYNSKHTSHWLGATPFADMTNEEYRKQYLGYKLDVNAIPDVDANTWALKDVVAATDVDHRAKGAVTPIKDQGQCGSCWAFSTTGSVEGAHFYATKQLVSVSEQQLVDCDKKSGDDGCNGGLMDNAFQYIINNKGIDTESDYPYKAVDGTCDKTKQAKHAVTITGFQDVPKNSELDLRKAVTTTPVSVAIEADQSSFQLYKGGIYDAKDCGTQLDHGVLAVGYHHSGTVGQDYWIVKNSWGVTWGMKGYIQLAMGGHGKEGQCGIAMAASYPTVTKSETVKERLSAAIKERI